MTSNSKVAIVTGAGSGIGKAAALALLQDGYRVVLAGRRPEPLQAVIAESGASIKDIAHDRAFSGPDVSAVHAVCTVETRDRTHIAALHRALKKNGFPLVVAK